MDAPTNECPRCKINRDTLIEMLSSDNRNHGYAVTMITNCTECKKWYENMSAESLWNQTRLLSAENKTQLLNIIFGYMEVADPPEPFRVFMKAVRYGLNTLKQEGKL